MSDIIYTAPVSAGTTINPTNQRIPVRQNATTFIDSFLEQGGTFLFSNYGGFTGLGLDFGNRVTYIGDWNNLINGTTFVVNDNSQTIYTLRGGTNNGIVFDFNLKTYQFGDMGVSTSIFIDSNNEYISFNISSIQLGIIDNINSFVQFGNNECILLLDFANRTSILGDYGNFGIGLYLQVDNNNNFIGAYNSNGNYGLALEYANNIFSLGDRSGLVNNTYIAVDDSASSINTNCVDFFFDISNTLNFNGASLQSNTASGNSGEHLVIYLNGVQYKIQLLNP